MQNLTELIALTAYTMRAQDTPFLSPIVQHRLWSSTRSSRAGACILCVSAALGQSSARMRGGMLHHRNDATRLRDRSVLHSAQIVACPRHERRAL
eukprot:5210774-Amphidinium_carterae.1